MATIAEDTTKGIKKKSPRDFLNTVVGRPVVVKLNNGVIYPWDFGLFRWIHEYCDGANGGIREWPAEEEIR